MMIAPNSFVHEKEEEEEHQDRYDATFDPI